jgi:hypothetical protein
LPRYFIISGQAGCQVKVCRDQRPWTLIRGASTALRNLLPRISRCDELCCRYPYLVPFMPKSSLCHGFAYIYYTLYWLMSRVFRVIVVCCAGEVKLTITKRVFSLDSTAGSYSEDCIWRSETNVYPRCASAWAFSTDILIDKK